jgi:hypothetical protein
VGMPRESFLEQRRGIKLCEYLLEEFVSHSEQYVQRPWGEKGTLSDLYKKFS